MNTNNRKMKQELHSNNKVIIKEVITKKAITNEP